MRLINKSKGKKLYSKNKDFYTIESVLSPLVFIFEKNGKFYYPEWYDKDSDLYKNNTFFYNFSYIYPNEHGGKKFGFLIELPKEGGDDNKTFKYGVYVKFNSTRNVKETTLGHVKPDIREEVGEPYWLNIKYDNVWYQIDHTFYFKDIEIGKLDEVVYDKIEFVFEYNPKKEDECLKPYSDEFLKNLSQNKFLNKPCYFEVPFDFKIICYNGTKKEVAMSFEGIPSFAIKKFCSFLGSLLDDEKYDDLDKK